MRIILYGQLIGMNSGLSLIHRVFLLFDRMPILQSVPFILRMATSALTIQRMHLPQYSVTAAFRTTTKETRCSLLVTYNSATYLGVTPCEYCRLVILGVCGCAFGSFGLHLDSLLHVPVTLISDFRAEQHFLAAVERLTFLEPKTGSSSNSKHPSRREQSTRLFPLAISKAP
jgi:hypothetical protein